MLVRMIKKAHDRLSNFEKELKQQELEIKTLREKSSNSELFADEISLLKDQVDTERKKLDVILTEENFYRPIPISTTSPILISRAPEMSV